MKRQRNHERVHPPLAAYTHQCEVSGPQRWLVLAGQIRMSSDGMIPGDPVEQFRLALANIAENLRAADMPVSDVIKLTMFLVDEIGPEQRQELLTAWLEAHRPAMAPLYVAALANPAIKVEIDVLASHDDM